MSQKKILAECMGKGKQGGEIKNAKNGKESDKWWKLKARIQRKPHDGGRLEGKWPKRWSCKVR